MCMLDYHLTHDKEMAVPPGQIRCQAGSMELTENEWSRACNLRDRYWLYVVFDCGTTTPRLFRVQNPFSKLIATSKGSLLIDGSQILASAGQSSEGNCN